MPIWEGQNQLPWSDCQKRASSNEPKEAARNCRLVTTQEPNRSLQFPRLYWILQVLHPQLLKNCLTNAGSHKENHPLALGRSPTQSIWRTEDANVQKPSTHPTQCGQTIHTTCWCLSLEHGHHSLAGGTPYHKNPCSMTQTSLASSCILFSHLHTYRMRLWHLWKGTTGCHESFSPLETLP